MMRKKNGAAFGDASLLMALSAMLFGCQPTWTSGSRSDVPPQSVSVCVAPFNKNNRTNTIVWPGKTRPVWRDPGPAECPLPVGLDAGLCVRTYPLRTGRGSDGGFVRCLPSFIIFGVQKAGTRELRNWLNVHPNLMGHNAELGYLDNPGCTTESWRRAKPNETKMEAANICDFSGNGADAEPKQRRGVTKAKKDKKGKRKGQKQDLLQRGRRSNSAADDLRYFWRGYLDRFPPQHAASRRAQYSFEKTPKYIEMTTSRIHRLHAVMPSLKFLLVLRNPVSRAYSWYNMACLAASKDRGGGARGFAEILDGEFAGELWAITRTFLHNKSQLDPKMKWKIATCSAANFEKYILQGFKVAGSDVPTLRTTGVGSRSGADKVIIRGHYAEKLDRWTKVFPKNQFQVILMDEMLSQSSKTMADIETFLGIPHFPYSKHFGVSRTGSTVLLGVHSKIERPYKENIEPMTPFTLDLLERYYASHHDSLLKLIGRDHLPWGR